MLCDNISVSAGGHLLLAGQDTVKLAHKYKTPLYLLDEDKIRANCRMYKEALARNFGAASTPLYASKVNCFKRLYEIMREEDMSIDVVSPGEIYTALKAGYDPARAYFHSNNKTDEDIAYALDNHIGCFVADNIEEVRVIQTEAQKRGIRQKLLLRLTPGIDPHTFDAVATGKLDAKFGAAIETGQAEKIALAALSMPNIDLRGFHCHVGSQIFAGEVFARSAVIMLEFIAMMKEKHGFVTGELDLGGGFGVRYVESDPKPDIKQEIARIAAAVKSTCKQLGIGIPVIHMEPGRSIIADAGMVLYTVGAVKHIPGCKNFVSIDGGMADSPRHALYKAAYTCLTANKMNEEAIFKATLAGRCCESGDILQEDVMFPASVARHDIVAVCTAGAYHYSMASNYNRLPKPATVMLAGGGSYVAVRRETLADIVRNDV